MEPSIRSATVADAVAISALVQEGFAQFVAPSWEVQAQAVFVSQSTSERFTTSIPTAAFAAVAEAVDQLVGVILLPTPSLLGFLFVRAGWQRRGVASQLWESARRHLEAHHPTTHTVELNSSPYAVAAYKALGFYPISKPFRRGGCLATRMACWLPGRTLERGQPQWPC
jgi:GNAT superfamily N-acetyltransferase